MTATTKQYEDSFVDYCFRMGKLEADKVFWDRMLVWRKNYREVKQRDVQRRFDSE